MNVLIKNICLVMVACMFLNHSSALAFESLDQNAVNDLEKKLSLVKDNFFKSQPWDFLAQKLVKNPTRESSPIGFLQFLFISASDVTFFLLAAILISYSYREITDKMYASLSLCLIGSTLFTVFFHKYICNLAHQYNLRANFDYYSFEALIKILKDYNPDLTKNESTNTKRFVPQELYSTFDALWDVYQKYGQDGLCIAWDPIKKSFVTILRKHLDLSKFCTK